jgi:hypothetical protein
VGRRDGLTIDPSLVGDQTAKWRLGGREPAGRCLRLTRMAKFLGQLLFELLWDLAWRQVHAIIWQMIQKADAWLGTTKLSKRTALAVGLLLGLAAWGIWPLLAWLLAN